MTTKIDQFLTSESKAEYEHLHVELPVFLRSPRVMMSAMLMASDSFSFLLAGLLANATRAIFVGEFSIEIFVEIIPFIFLSQVLFAVRRLYPGIGVSPVNELRRLTGSTTIIFLLLAAMTFWFRNPENYSRINLALTWGFALVLVPVGRALMREICGRLGFFGEPTVIIGFGERGKDIVSSLQVNKGLGLRPVLIIDGWDEPNGKTYKSVPITHLDEPEKFSSLSRDLNVNTAIIVTSEIPHHILEAAEKISQSAFKSLILIPDREQIGGLGIRKYDLDMIFGLEVKRSLFNTWEKTVKRATDLFLVLSGGLFITPLLLLISVLVKIDSRGSVLYGSTRIGKDKRKFKAWKFRTMKPDADQLLTEYLEKDPQLREEWKKNFKLRDDPRITRVGKILRKLSLDELPQLWNVLVGEMSLVGPRPKLNDEITTSGDVIELYALVPPGITGLWQVSGRNGTTYEKRLFLEEYYVRNWSIWLDIYILARTVGVVLKRQGAY